MLHRVFLNSRNWRRPLWVALAVLCAWYWGGASTAQASCGDYVMIGGHAAGRHGDRFDDRSAAGDPRGTRDPRAAAGQLPGSGPKSPCNGPGCRQHRELPASPSTRVTLDEHSWGLPPRLAGMTPPLLTFVAVSSAPVVAISVSTGIFRPPRFGVA